MYAYERRYFLIDEEDSVIDYTPKIKHTPTVAIKPVHPINRPRMLYQHIIIYLICMLLSIRQFLNLSIDEHLFQMNQQDCVTD